MESEKEKDPGAPPPYQETYTPQPYPQMPPNHPYPQAPYPPTHPLSGPPAQMAGHPPVYNSTGAPVQPVYTYQPHGQQQGGPIVAHPPNHAVLAWFACLCCFCPLGIVAILKSKQVDEAIQRGDIQHANIASRTSRQLSLISICIGTTCIVFSVVFVVLFATAIASISKNRY